MHSEYKISCSAIFEVSVVAEVMGKISQWHVYSCLANFSI